MASLSSDPISPKGRGKCRSERLAGCCGDGLRTRLCGRLVGWVRERAYLRTVLREMPRECATGSGHSTEPDRKQPECSARESTPPGKMRADIATRDKRAPDFAFGRQLS